MEEQNMFLWIKAAVTALCAAFSAAFGWLGWLVLAWAVCMVIDWISGSAAANVASTGVITYPMMAQAGFRPRFSASVIAVVTSVGTAAKAFVAARPQVATRAEIFFSMVFSFRES